MVELVDGVGGRALESLKRGRVPPMVKWESSRPVPPPQVPGPSQNALEDLKASQLKCTYSWRRNAQMLSAIIVKNELLLRNKSRCPCD